MRKFLVFVLLCMSLMSTQVFAQMRTVTGRVTDEGGNPLSGATVSAVGGRATVTTNERGSFTINVSSTTRQLQVTFVGYTTQTLSLGNRNSFDVSLTTTNGSLADVVVTGINRTKKSQYSGAVTVIGENQLRDIPAGSFDQMLQGKAPGVQVISGSGQPGSSANVIIRGLNSILGGNSPLYVVDGIPVEAGVFQSFNPNDFASMDILKDAAASALYGSRGSAGVIVVTTKRGAIGKMRLTVDQQYGRTSRPDFTYTMMTTPQLLKAQEDLGSFFARNGTPSGGAAANLPGWLYSRNNPAYAALTPSQQARYNTIYDSISSINTNWDDQFFRTGSYSNTNISLSGGQGKTRIYNNIGYYSEDGVTLRTDMRRLTLRSNIDYADDKFNFSLSTNLGYTKRDFQQSTTTNSTGNPFLVARIAVPYQVVRNPDGTFATGTPAKYVGPNDLDLTFRDQNYSDQLKATISTNFSYQVVKDLTIGMLAGIDFRETQASNYGNPLAFTRVSSTSITGHAGFQTESLTRFFQADIRPFITYRKTIAEKHDFEISGFGEYVQQVQKGFSATGYGVNPKTPNTIAGVTQGNGVNQLYAVVGGALGGSDPAQTQNAIVSGLGTARYTYNNKYTLNASYRYDGSSTLPAANRWTGFYSVGANWDIMKENFMDNIRAINTLRLRVSYGGSGNANNSAFGNYSYLPTYTSSAYSGLTSLVPNQPGNPQERWEVTKTLNIGLDYAFLKSRLYGDLNVYNRRTTDAFAQLTLSATAGFGNGAAQPVNSGIVQNRGFEYTVNLDVIKTRNLIWTLNVNGSYNANKVLSLGGIGSFASGTSLIEVGKPLGSQYTVKYGGVDAATGAPLYYDLNGKLTTLYSSSYQQNAFGTWVAPWNGGFGTTLRYGNFDLSVLFSYQKGSNKSNNVEYFVENPVGFMAAGYNQANTLNFWKNPGDIASTPSPLYSTNFSSQQIEDASFLRLREFTVAYTLPKSVVSKSNFISNVRLYVTGRNLFIWTKWRGYDPESGASNIILGEYPNPRSVTGGITVAF